MAEANTKSWIAQVGWLLFSFSGRASRPTFLIGILGAGAITVAAFLVLDRTIGLKRLSGFDALFSLMLGIGLFNLWVLSALAVKRLRDIDIAVYHVGWVLLGFVALPALPALAGVYVVAVLLGLATVPGRTPSRRIGSDTPIGPSSPAGTPPPAAPQGVLETLFSFTGRIGRRSYFVWATINYVAGFTIGLAAMRVGWVIVVLVPGVWAWYGLTIKRLHDIDRSGWHALWYTVFGGILGSAANSGIGTPGDVLYLGFFVLLHLWLSLVPGTSGPNRFGGDPAEAAQTEDREARTGAS